MQTVIAEASADLSAFPKQFASCLGLCPTRQRRGGKILNRRTRKVVNRATVAFRNAAMTLLRSQWLSVCTIPTSAYAVGNSRGQHRGNLYPFAHHPSIPFAKLLTTHWRARSRLKIRPAPCGLMVREYLPVRIKRDPEARNSVI
jgi:hypothetical protein